MSTTVADVAKHVGVSTSTASDVLRGRPGYSKKTRERVLAASKELNFVPNHLAKSLLSRRSHTIGVVAALHQATAADMLNAITHDLVAQGYMPLFMESSVVKTDVELAQRQWRGRAVDGVIVAGDYEEKVRQCLMHNDAPTVCISGRPIENCHCVVRDLARAMADGVHRLASLGRKRIAFLGIDNERVLRSKSNSNAIKIEGWRKAMVQLGLDAEGLLLSAAVPFGQVREFVVNNVERFRSLDAVMGSNDQVAIEAMTALKQIGVQVPEQCSVTGFDDTSFAVAVEPRLSTYAPMMAEVGSAAVSMLLDLIDGKQRENVTIVPEFICRESVSPREDIRS